MGKRIAWLITTGLVASSLAIPGIAAAHTNEAIAETGGMMLTLPGVGVNVDVVLDEFGNIEDVGVVDLIDPAPAEAGDPMDAHKVRFEIDEDGTRLSVMAKKHKLTSKVQAGSLAALAGPHVWSAVLFPEHSEDLTTVTFNVSGSDGDPSIAGIEVAVPPGGDPEITYSMSGGDDDGADDAMVVITFSWNGYTKILKIKVDVDDDDEDDGDDGPSAVLKIELRAKDRQRLRGDDVAGDHTWNGLLCDGTAVSVPYNIGPGGELTVTPGDGYTVKNQERGFQVTFDGSKARLHVKFGQTDDGTWDLKVDAKTTEKCKHNPNRGKKDKPEKAARHDRDGDDHEDKDHDEDDD